MNKKGFTLIELLSVVTLIVLISLIVIPNILSNINNKKGEISDANMQLLAGAADVYIENHAGMYVNSYEANGSTYCISLQTLIDSGVLETPFKDVSGNEVDYSNVVKATYNSGYNGFLYELVEKDLCTEVVQYVSRPILADGMIPVIYDDGVWKKADSNSKWYNYAEKKWANAVLVREWKGTESGSKGRYDYLEAPTGTTILESDILAYFVWVPRYRYQLFSSNIPISINIVFEGIGTTKSTGTVSGQWLTHPAFTYNGKELSGIWVGKYEVSNQDNNIVIKSGKTPWKGISHEHASNSSLNMSSQGNIYGLKEVNSHMILNSEWSAVAYLSNSKYGINSQIASASSVSTGQSVSTTDNETGIFDMSGLSSEFVVMDYNTLDLGQAMSETNGWYGDANTDLTSNLPYMTRGGTSIYNYNSVSYNDVDMSYRVTIVNSSSSPVLRGNMYIVSSGDGLYRSKADPGRLVYRGLDPNNKLYLKEDGVNNTLYRIVSYESDGTIKVVRDEKLSTDMSWDDIDARTPDGTNNTYCLTPSYGCNVWGTQSDILYNGDSLGSNFHYKYYAGPSESSLTSGPAGTVNDIATLNDYLNNGSWTPKTTLNQYIDNHSFNVGGPYYSKDYELGSKGFQKEKEEESLYTWTGKIGLLNITEYAEASTNSSCGSVYSNYYYNYPNFYYMGSGESEKTLHPPANNDYPCKLSNWTYKSYRQPSLTSFTGNQYGIWVFTENGYFSGNATRTSFGIRPAFYLKSTVRLSGDGTTANPYYIAN